MAIGFREKNDNDPSMDRWNLDELAARAPANMDTVRGAQILFTDFYHQEFRLQGVSIAEEEDRQRQLDEYSRQLMATVGEDLRRIAEQIHQSRERQIIRSRADQINFEISSYEIFRGLLEELFPNGQITREGIVVLFFFCSDLALKAYSMGTFCYFNRIIGWSLRFIYFNICAWVQSQGGWERILKEYVPATAVTICSILGSLALAIYIRKNL